jgi:tetratricopeptide (TPR) repeat protein
VDELLRQGISAARSGQRERARDLLMRVVRQNQENVTAWLWLSGVVDSLEVQEICLENVLALDPTHDTARKGLAWVRQQQEATPPVPAEPILPFSSPQAREPVSPAAAILREDFARRLPPPPPEPEPPPIPLPDELDDEYQCPCCAAQSAPDDRNCPACGNGLWTRTRRREERSSWLWVALTLQAASVIWPTFIILVVLFYASYQAGLDNFFRLVPVYLGLPGDVPPETASAAFQVVPRLYILPFVTFILFALAVFVGLFLRWKPVFYLFLISALLTLVLAIVGMAVGLGLPSESMVLNPRVGVMCSGGGLILALLMLLLVLQIEDDFFFDETRLLLRPDRDATNGPALLSSGQRYAKRNMWALAAIHLRRATSQMPHVVDPHVALAVAYLNLRRYDLAESALEEARRINPDEPQVERLEVMLTSWRDAESPSPRNTTA